jgi:tight adherence protein C
MLILDISVLLAILAAGGILLAAWSLKPVPPDTADVVEGRLRVYAGTDITSLEEIELRAPFRQRVIQPVLAGARRFITRRLPEKEREELQRRLAQAGRPGGLSASDFVAIRYGATLALCLVGGLVGLLTAAPAMVAAGATVGAVVGLYAPMFWLRFRINRRKDQILAALPDALDLLIVCVEAGLSFDAAIERVADKLQNALGDEFGRVLQEKRLGRPRLEALDDLGRRSGVEEVHNFIQAVIQSEQLGSSIARILHVQSDEIRQKRVLRAQAHAGRASLLMLGPMVCCIFPTLWIILLGPAVILAVRFFAHA